MQTCHPLYTDILLRYPISIIFIALLVVSACDSTPEEPEFTGTPRVPTCTLAQQEIVNGGVGRDVIPVLTDPPMTSAEEATYLLNQDRILGLRVDGQAYAIPHNILWFHEIVNLNLPSIQLAVTYCPFTGTGMAFDRTVIQGNEFRVSGLLYQNNLIMFDQTNEESLWPQMSRRAECGPKLGASLKMLPMFDIQWGKWKELYPDTHVLSSDTGYNIRYTSNNYPYGNYEDPDSEALLFPMELDPRRPPKERLLGVPDIRRGGTAFPLSELDNGQAANVVHAVTSIGTTAIFWDHQAYTAMAYKPEIEGRSLQFVVENDTIQDQETGSQWTIDGLAVSGELQGMRLEPVENSYVAFWFAWAAFLPETTIWTAD